MDKEKTIKDLLYDIYRLIQTNKKLISEKEYPGKEIDTSYFNGMNDNLKEVFGRLDMYKLLDLPLLVAEQVAKGDYKIVEENNDK